MYPAKHCRARPVSGRVGWQHKGGGQEEVRSGVAWCTHMQGHVVREVRGHFMPSFRILEARE